MSVLIDCSICTPRRRTLWRPTDSFWMKKLAAIPALVICLLFGTTLHAETGEAYAGFQYASGSYSEAASQALNPTLLMGRLGKYINDWFSLEGRVGAGIEDDSLNFPGTDISLNIDSVIGVYGLGHIDLNQVASVYGLLGVTRAEATVSSPGLIPNSEDEAGLSFGVGADLDIGNRISMNIEYLQYLNKSNFDFSAIGVGFIFGF